MGGYHGAGDNALGSIQFQDDRKCGSQLCPYLTINVDLAIKGVWNKRELPLWLFA
jgi:hypothetical protein